jgi:hypothetical protein
MDSYCQLYQRIVVQKGDGSIQKRNNNPENNQSRDVQTALVSRLFPRTRAMTPQEIKAVVQEVLSEQRIANKADLDDVAVKTIATILTSFGIDEDDRKEVKADFQHLRKWRKSVEQAQTFTFKAIVTVIISGIIGAFWLGFKATIGK